MKFHSFFCRNVSLQRALIHMYGLWEKSDRRKAAYRSSFLWLNSELLCLYQRFLFVYMLWKSLQATFYQTRNCASQFCWLFWIACVLSFISCLESIKFANSISSQKKDQAAQIRRGYLMPPTDSPWSDLRTFYLKRFGFSRNSAAASWLSGSLGLGSKNRKMRPMMTLPISRTGFQSARRIFRHTLPSVSMFGWYTAVSQCTIGALWGY